jgi:hypothetical protein
MIQWLRKSVFRIVPTSIAGRAAAVTVVLLLSTATAAELFLWSRDDSLKAKGAAVIALFIPIISGLVYAIVHFWGEEDQSLYPDIDRAWSAGINALHNVGVTLSQGTEPLFLILGGGSIEAAFVEHMQASGEVLKVKGVPAGAGEAPSLRWYATDSAVFLFVSDVGALATLARDWTKCSHEEHVDWAETMKAGHLTAQHKAAVVVGRHITKTYTGLDLDDDSAFDSSVGPLTPQPPPKPNVIRLPMAIDMAQHNDRISYLGSLIRRARHPRCGLNGVVAIMPLELAVADRHELDGLVRAIRSDLQALHIALRLRFPVFGLVTGMEQAVGFNEFAKQLGREISLEHRLGSGFSVYSWATGERLQWLSDRICNAFEDFTYGLFSQSDALGTPYENCKLYHLLCRVRQRMKPQLNQVLAPAFRSSSSFGGTEASARDEGRSAVYFGGCYLAATGPTPEEGQAFVKAVLYRKLKEHEHHVEWTERALSAHRRFKALVWLGWTVVGLLTVLLAWRLLNWLWS